MFEIKQKPKQAERALLVSVYRGLAQKEESESLLEELKSLVDTLGIPVLDSLLVRVQEPNPRYFVGSGKAEEIFEQAKQLEADVIVFDNELSPAQQTQLGGDDRIGCDRSGRSDPGYFCATSADQGGPTTGGSGANGVLTSAINQGLASSRPTGRWLGWER